MILSRRPAAKVSVILRTRDDWHSWIEDIKSVALLSKVWGYIDPSKQEGELEDIPKEPEALADTATYAEIMIFKIKYNRYQQINRGIAAISETIHDSLSAPIKHSYMNNQESPYQVLKALKKQFAPNKEELQIMAIQRYQQARLTPIQQSNPEAWLTEFEGAYYGMRHHDLPEAQDIHLIPDFLGAVLNASKEWVMSRRNLLHQSGYKSQTIADTIAAYREYLSDNMLDEDTKLDVEFNAPPTLQGAGISRQSSRSQSRQPSRTDRVPHCVCGQKHFFRECPYVVRSMRKTDFVEDPKIRIRLDNILKVSGAKCNMLKKAMKGNDQDTQQHFMAAIPVGFSAASCVLKESFILASSTPAHICNDKARFKEVEQVPAGYLRAGDATVPIEGTGVVEISPNCRGTSNVTISLQETVYVPHFHTNVVSASRMKRAGYIWDFAGDRVVKNGREVCRLAECQGLWVIEQNSRKGTSALPDTHPVRRKTPSLHSAKPLESSGNASIWHKH